MSNDNKKNVKVIMQKDKPRRTLMTIFWSWGKIFDIANGEFEIDWFWEIFVGLVSCSLQYSLHNLNILFTALYKNTNIYEIDNR